MKMTMMMVATMREDQWSPDAPQPVDWRRSVIGSWLQLLNMKTTVAFPLQPAID